MSLLGSRRGYIIGGILLVLLVALIVGMLFIHKAEVIIYYTSEPIKKTIDINKNLPIKKNTITISEKGSVATTGNKLIGEKAKGQITIYNAEDTDKTFKKGTELETDDGLAYVLTEDVQAPSAEQTITEDGDILTTTTKTKANIEAKEIGKKYNIKTDIDLIIDGAPKKNHFARTSSAIAGGTEKEVQTASRDDYDRLKKDISKKITQKSNAEVSKANKSLKIISALTQVDILDETYSKEVGDETDTLELSAKAEVTYYSYNNDQMLAQISEQLQDDLDSKHTLSENQIKYSFSNVDLEDDVVTGEIDVNAQPVLQIDSDVLKSEIAGKSQDSIQDVLKSKYGADGYDFAGYPQFPPFTSIAPLLKNNITITVKPL